MSDPCGINMPADAKAIADGLPQQLMDYNDRSKPSLTAAGETIWTQDIRLFFSGERERAVTVRVQTVGRPDGIVPFGAVRLDGLSITWSLNKEGRTISKLHARKIVPVTADASASPSRPASSSPSSPSAA